jgi:hypothetical protein
MVADQGIVAFILDDKFELQGAPQYLILNGSVGAFGGRASNKIQSYQCERLRAASIGVEDLRHCCGERAWRR